MAANSAMPEPIRSKPEPAALAVPTPLAPRGNLRETYTQWRNNAAALPPGLSGTPDLPGLLKALRRRWFVAASLGIVCAGVIGGAVFNLMPPKFTAFAQIHLNSTHPYLVFASPEAGRGEFLTYQSTQAAKIKSRFVLNAALKRDEVKSLSIVSEQPDPIMWLEDEIKVEFKDGAEVMNISMTSVDSAAALTLVNAVLQAYLDGVTKEEPRQKSQRISELEDILNKANIKLKQKKDLFRQRAEELGTSEASALTQKQVNLLTTLGEYRNQHARFRGDLMRGEGRLKAHLAQEKMMTDPQVPDIVIAEAVEADPYCRQHLQRLARLNEICKEYEDIATQKDENSYVRAKESRKGVVKALDARIAELRTDVGKRYKLKAQTDYKATFAQIKSEVELIAENEKTLHEQVENLTREADSMGKSSTELEMLRADIRREEKAVEQVGDQAQHLGIELRSPPRVKLYQEAGLQKKDTKRQMMAMVGGPAFGFAGICFGVAWLEFRKRRIGTTDEVTTGLGMRVLGVVPALTGPAPGSLVGADSEDDRDEHNLVESIDSIRTLLLRDAAVDPMRVLMVTSALAGEGKTTLASHLATSLARAGRKTLLIDSDLRSPAAHQLFELPLQPGLSEALLGEVHVAEATRATSVDGLWMMPAGHWDREVMHALARTGLEDIFDKLKSEYDFIVVDSHPVLPANDSVLIGQHVDAVLFSLLRDVSQAPRVYAACQRLSNLGIRVLGAVVNGMKADDYYAKAPHYKTNLTKGQ